MKCGPRAGGLGPLLRRAPARVRGAQSAPVTDAPTIRRALEASGLVPLDAQVLLAHVIGRDRAWLAAHAGDALPRHRRRRILCAREAPPRRRAGRLPDRRARILGIAACRVARGADPAAGNRSPGRAGALAACPTIATSPCSISAPAAARSRWRSRMSGRARRFSRTDTSADALAIARANAQRLGLANVEFVAADWYDGVPRDALRPDRLQSAVCRAARPASSTKATCASSRARRSRRAAMASTRCGRSSPARARISRRAARSSSSTAYDQSEAVRALFADAGFADIVAARDLAGIPRVVAGRAAA